MARDTTAVTQRKQVSVGAATETTHVVARPVDTFVTPAIDGDLKGLLDGLSTLNPAINHLANVSDAKAADEAFLAGQQEGRVPDAPSQSPESMPDRVNTAFKSNFALGYRESIGAKMAADGNEAFMAGYNKDRMRPDFDAEGYIAEFQKKELTGLTDPVVRDAVLKQMPGTIKAIREDARAVQMARIKENTISSNASALRSAVSGDQDPATMHASLQAWMEMAGGKNSSGLQSKTELMQMAFNQVHSLSIAAGGDPSAFDVFNIPFPAGHDQAGKTMADLNQGLADNIATARKQAEHQRDQRITQALQKDFYSQDLKWQQAAEAGNLPSAAELADHIGPTKMFANANAAFAKYESLRTAAAKVKDLTGAVGALGSGEGWKLAGLPKETRDAAMNQVTGPMVATLMQHSPGQQGAEPAKFQAAVDALVKVHAGAGADLHSVQLKAMLEGVKAAAPAKGAEPSATFLNAAALYKSLPANLRGIYASEDTASILEGYNSAIAAGIDKVTAVGQAYSAASAETKADVAKWAKDPVNEAAVHSWAKNLPTGWLRDTFGSKWMGTYPTNEEVMQGWAFQQAKQWKLRNPNGEEGQLKAYIQQETEQRWLYDKATNKVIEVPRGRTGEYYENVVGETTAKLSADAVRLYGNGTTTSLVKDAAGDSYTVIAYPRGGGHPVTIGQTSMGEMEGKYTQEHSLNDAEKAAFGPLQLKIRASTG